MDNINGIIISRPIGRLGNHIIVLMNAIYMGQKFNYRWIVFSDEFKAFPKVLDIKEKKMYKTINDVKIECKLKPLSGFMVFHISHYLGESRKIIDYQQYKKIYQDFFPVLVKGINDSNFEFNNGRNIKKFNVDDNKFDENKTLYTHLKFTDNLLPNLHFKYNVLPINLYVKLLTDYNFDKLVVVTDNARATWLFELNNRLKKINKTLEVISGNIWDDYMILINAKYIVMDMSTFTWTAHLASPRTQNVFMWPLFFTRFLAKYRQYVDIMLFNEADMMKKENYCYYNLLRYPECGEWYATKPHLDLLNTWESNNLRILNSNVLEGWFKDRDSLSDDDKNDNFELPDTNNILEESENDKEFNCNRKIALIGPGIMEIPPKGWGAVEILIWEYYQELKRLGWDVDIINTPKTEEIIQQIERQQAGRDPYQFVHLHYDIFYPILDKINSLVPHIAFTSHYPYIDKPEKHRKDQYDRIFNFMKTQGKYYNVMLSQKDVDAIVSAGANTKKIHMIKNGANAYKFKFTETCEYPERSICLGWITKRKRQSFLQRLPELNIYFAGRAEDTDFNYNSPYYMGEWTKDQVYTELTKYSNLVLLSGGEADPLVVKEAMMAGIGIVVNETSAAHLDTNYQWLSIIPKDKENDIVYIKDVILKNRWVANKPESRREIREYAEQHFSNKIIVKDYSDWLSKLIMPKPRIVLVGTGISEIPAKGWGACEGIVWEYYNRLKSLNYPVKIVNDPHKNYQKMIKEINDSKADYVHIMYDDRIDIVPFINKRGNKPEIIYTSHWGYLPQIKNKRNDPYFTNIFQKALISQNKISYFVLSNEIKQIYQDAGVNPDRIRVVHNGADAERFRFSEIPKYKDRTIYLAKVDFRKRQHLFQGIKSLYFAGNVADARFNRNSERYLGEWTRDQVYQNLTDYPSLALLSDGEADPLTVKEALMAGCGIVISKYSTANLDLDKPWITVIPEDKITNIAYLEEELRKNREMCLNPIVRREIRQYAEDKFGWGNIIWNNYLKMGLDKL